ncbi:MAG TPA: SRPBCC family protein [Anaerolineales bacterium]|nr:SRPBCC family protein [Anaerolineales bacterium]
MKTRTFEKEIFIQSDAATVIDVLVDYSQYPKFHPLITKVEHTTDESAGVKRFIITNGVKWGPFKFKTRHRADIISVTEETVHIKMYQPPSTFITNLTKITPQDSGVLLHETITMRAPDMFFEYVFQQAKAAHAGMLERIKGFVEKAS